MAKKTSAQLDRDIAASLAKAKKPRVSSPPAWIVPREPGAASLLDNPKLRAWFGNSHVVDMWGEPLAVYHGTGSTFGTFDPAKAGSHSNPGCPIRGIYFGDEDTARTWARGHRNGRIIKAYLRIEQPLYVYGRPNCNQEDEALAQGHDGIIQQGGGEWVVFDPAQIKIINKAVK